MKYTKKDMNHNIFEKPVEPKKESLSIHSRHCPDMREYLSWPFRPTGRKGAGTLEIVIIIAVLISVALIFREALMHYATALIQSVFGDHSQIADLFIR